jgi:hypothetical protein
MTEKARSEATEFAVVLIMRRASCARTTFLDAYRMLVKIENININLQRDSRRA